MQKHKSLQKQTEKIVESETWCMGALAGIGRRVQVTYSRVCRDFVQNSCSDARIILVTIQASTVLEKLSDDSWGGQWGKGVLAERFP